MTTFYCEEIACGGCAARIDKAFEAAGIGHSVDVEKRTVAVDGPAGQAAEILSDLGFTPVQKQGNGEK